MINFDEYSGRHSTNVVTCDYEMTLERDLEIRDLAKTAKKLVENKNPFHDNSRAIRPEVKL